MIANLSARLITLFVSFPAGVVHAAAIEVLAAAPVFAPACILPIADVSYFVTVPAVAGTSEWLSPLRC